jgi:hypothetical protein
MAHSSTQKPVPKGTDNTNGKKKNDQGRRFRKKIRFFFIFLILVVLGAVAFYGKELYTLLQRVSVHQTTQDTGETSEPSSLPATSNNNEATEKNQLASLEARINQAQEDLKNLTLTVGSFQKENGKDRQSASSAEHEQRLQGLEQKWSQLEERSQKNRQILLTFWDLKQEFYQQKPYSASYALLEKLSHDDASLLKLLSDLKSLSLSGAPSLLTLKDLFEKTAIESSSAVPGEEEGKSVFERIKLKISGLIKIRKIGEQDNQEERKEDKTQLILISLMQNNLVKALDILKSSSHPLTPAMQEWQQKAEDVQKSHQALRNLEKYILLNCMMLIPSSSQTELSSSEKGSS